MNTTRVSSNVTPEQMAQNFSKITAFIIARINVLKQLGWSDQVIAEALGVDARSIEQLINNYRNHYPR